MPGREEKFPMNDQWSDTGSGESRRAVSTVAPISLLRGGRCQRRVLHFTLVELLAVLVIMVMIMGVAMPAFKNLTSGVGVDAAVRMVNAQLRLSRQYAITKRKRVAVLMPGPNATGLDFRHRYSCLRPAEVSGSGNTYTWVQWIDDTSWSFVPTGSAIMEVDNDTGIANGASTLVVNPVDNSFAATTIDYGEMSSLTTAAGPFNCRCVVFHPTGRILGDSDQVTVGDAVYMGSNNWAVKNPAQAGNPFYDNGQTYSCANQFNIALDAYTGRAVVTTPDEY